MLEHVMESFFSLLREKLVNYGFDMLRDRINLETIIETLERNMELLSSKAFDVEEEMKNAELLGKKKRKREVEEWLKHVQMIENEFRTLENQVRLEGFYRQLLNGDRVTQLNARVSELVEQSRHFGELLLDVHETRGETFLTTRLVGEAFQQNLERIWRCIAIDRLPSIGVYGMGGVGKTTLAKHINNRLVEKTQECVFWVTVSQVFTLKKLQHEIAHVIGLDLSDEHNEDKRAARLNQALSRRKKFVLILDDVWKIINLEKVGDPLSVAGSRLLITTRSLEVCRQIGCREVIGVRKLDKDEAWNLFTRTLGQEMTLSPLVQEIAMSISKVCDGLPLGIITIAGSMRGETGIHVWRNALTDLQESVMGIDEMEYQVFKVLKHSFDWLNPVHDKKGKGNMYTTSQLCFLYCSLYPEDYKIQRETLVRRFISEDLMNKRKSLKEQLDQGHSILDRLVNVCLLEQEHNCVKMHDLVRAMAIKITEGRAMVLAGHNLKEIPNEEEWTEDLEKISLMKNDIQRIPNGMSPICPKLSTLLLRANPLRLLSDSIFSRMLNLCVLDLSVTHIKKLPDSLSDLENLKALLLRQCRELVYVPDLGKLKALKELNLSGTAIKNLPRGMENLVNLRRLSMERASILEDLPTGFLLNFPSLQQLYLPYQIETPIEEIEGLKHLEEFQGRLKNVSDFNWFIRASQNRVYDTMYSIQVGSTYDGFSRSSNQVVFHRYNINRGKDKDVVLLAQDIQQLEFHQSEGLSSCFLDDLRRFNNPRSLKSLKLSNCKGIEFVLTDDEMIGLQTLEAIQLTGLRDFMGVIRNQDIGAGIPTLPPTSQAMFSCLRNLSISHCNKVKRLGLPQRELVNLEYILVYNCDEMEEIITAPDEDGRGEREDVVSLPRLKELHLSELPRLKNICKATIICNSVEIIALRGCSMLKKLSLFFPRHAALNGQHNYSPPPALRAILIREREKEWWESLEWEHSTHDHLLQPFLHFVR